MKKLKLIFVLGLMAQSMTAQELDFNAYKFRYQKYRGLLYNININGTNTYNYSRNSDNYDVNKFFSDKAKMPGMNFKGALRMDYFQMINTNKLQQNLSFRINLINNRNSNKIDRKIDFEDGLDNDYVSKNKSTDQNISADLNLDNRLYYRENKFFYFSTNSSFNVYGSKGRSETIANGTILGASEFSSNGLNLDVNIRLGAGWGRLEYVSDAIAASFLIRDLKQKAMIGDVNASQMLAISKAITNIRYRRFTDIRYQIIDQIEMLDSQLQLNGIVSNKQARYFTTIYDNWLYATNIARYSGKRFTYFTENTYNRNQNNINSYSTIFSKMRRSYINVLYRSGIGMEFSSSKQMNLNFQKSWKMDFGAFYTNKPVSGIFEDSLETPYYKREETKSNIENINIMLGGQYEYLYQPNTRTYLIAYIRPELNYVKLLEEKVDVGTQRLDNWSYSAQILSGLTYFRFINARVSFNANVSLNLVGTKLKDIYQFSQNELGKRSLNESLNNINYNFSLRYALF